jgi:hypothetical protein
MKRRLGLLYVYVIASRRGEIGTPNYFILIFFTFIDYTKSILHLMHGMNKVYFSLFLVDDYFQER